MHASMPSASGWAAAAAGGRRILLEGVLPNPKYALGIASELVGTLFNVSGKQLVRYAALTGRNWPLLIGVLLWEGVYPLFDMVALLLAPESTVLSVDGMIVVWNIILAPYTLGEPITLSKLVAASVVTLGTAGAGVFGSKGERERTSGEYLQLLGQPNSIVYYCIWLLIVLSSAALLHRYELRSRVSGLWQGVLAGWFGGSAFILKVVLEYVKEGEWWSGYLWAFVALFGLYVSCAILMLSFALKRHESTFIIPIYEGTVVLNGAINGYLVLNDYEGEAYRWQIATYWMSILVILFGLYLLVWWPAGVLGDGDAVVRWMNHHLRRPPGPTGREGGVRELDKEHASLGDGVQVGGSSLPAAGCATAHSLGLASDAISVRRAVPDERTRLVSLHEGEVRAARDLVGDWASSSTC